MFSSQFPRSLRAHRVWWLSAFDALAWGCAVVLATWVRLDLDLARLDWSRLLTFWAFVVALFLVLGGLGGLHRGRAAVASLDEMLLLGCTAAVTGLLSFVPNLTIGSAPLVPRSVPIITAFFAIVIMCWGRAVWRAGAEHHQRAPEVADSVPVLVFGAGDAGHQLIRSMLTSRDTPWRPVALLDDDPTKRHLRLSGVPVQGTSHDVARAASSTGAAILVIAVPGMDAPGIRALSRRALDAGLEVKVLPGVTDLLGHRVGIHDVRDLDLDDLLGRRQIDTDLASITGYVTGRRVLVTGAGGSIGSELCRQVSSWNPSELIMLDRDESALHAVQLSITGRALLDTPDVVLADIRDTEAITAIFRHRRPHVVFHAAALKHLPMLEQYPAEAVKTNVWGSLNVLEAALATGVDRFVNISTDKAAEPISVLGYSKRIVERLTTEIAQSGRDGTYLSVRFGNVLGSRGSVLESFASQIGAGGPVTVTDPLVTRYFMTVQEAVHLVIQAGAIGRSGEALVLDMGEPVSIAQVARRLIQLSGQDLAIEFTGLRAGEKVHEVLLGLGEVDSRPVHPMISHVTVPPLAMHEARAIATHLDADELKATLAGMCIALPPPADPVTPTLLRERAVVQP